MSADKQLKAYIDRVLRLKEEQDTLGEDIREIYAEAKGQGYDKTAMGAVVAYVRKRGKDGATAFEEKEMVFDTYLRAYDGLVDLVVNTSHTPAPARVRENIEQFDAETGEIIDDAPRADGGLNIITKHTEIATNEGGANPDSVDMAQGSVPDLEPSGPDVNGHPNSPEEANEMDRDTEGSLEAGSAPAENARKATATVAEPDSVTHAEAGEIPAPSFLTKPPSPLRPHCQRPEMCAGVGRAHCHTCSKAMREQEEFA